MAVLLIVVSCGWSQTVFADDLTAREQTIKQQLVAAAAQITELNSRMAALESSITDTQNRIERERAQIRRLARVLYAQPDSLAGALFQSVSIAEALTRIGDLTSAADRAVATRRALDQDLSRLSRQRAQLQSDRDRQEQLKKQLESQFSQLVNQALAAHIQLPVASPAVPTAASAIQQIILDAFAAQGTAAQTWALRVAKCESNYNPFAVNSYTGAAGLFQFLPSTWARTPWASQSVFDPVANSQAAAWLYQRSGPNQWSCR